MSGLGFDDATAIRPCDVEASAGYGPAVHAVNTSL
jgi:hypothetical protein